MGERLMHSDRYNLNTDLTSWVLVAHRSGARIFVNDGPGKGLRLIQTLDHPEGRLKNREIDTDRPGSAFGNGTLERHALERHETSHEKLSEDFARSLASVLEDARTHQRFDRVFIVADPSFLGMVRSFLSNQTAALVAGSLSKDLAYVKDAQMTEHLEALIPI
jgi:protein required for attachment to host cells